VILNRYSKVNIIGLHTPSLLSTDQTL